MALNLNFISMRVRTNTALHNDLPFKGIEKSYVFKINIILQFSIRIMFKIENNH